MNPQEQSTSKTPQKTSIPRRVKSCQKKNVLVDGKEYEYNVKSPKKMDKESFKKWQEKKLKEAKELSISPSNSDGVDVTSGTPRKSTVPRKISDVHDRKLASLAKRTTLTEEFAALMDGDLTKPPTKLLRNPNLASPQRCLARAYEECLAIDVKYSIGYSGGRIPIRVIILDENLEVVYNVVVAPVDGVLNYCAHYTGVTDDVMKDAVELTSVRGEVAHLLERKLLVGYRINATLRMLGVACIPQNRLRDISEQEFIRKAACTRDQPTVVDVVRNVFRQKGYNGEDKLDEVARQCMRIYLHFRDEWEAMNIGSIKIDPKQITCNCCDKPTFWS